MLVYFFLAFFTDIMPISAAKKWFRSVTDFFYTTITWPFAFVSHMIILCMHNK